MSISRRQYLQLMCGAAIFPQYMAQASEKEPLNLDEYRGKVVFVDFWASWCTPCKKSMPWLNSIANELSGEGLVVLGVNVDANKKDADSFLKKYPADFPIVYDSNGRHASYYSIEGMPSSLIFSREGKLLNRHVGFVSGHTNEYRDNLLKALKS